MIFSGLISHLSITHQPLLGLGVDFLSLKHPSIALEFVISAATYRTQLMPE
jgi:hypothetical protein